MATGPDEAAFPRPCGAANREEQNLEQTGMTMREWYAGQALCGLLADGDFNVKPAVAAELAFKIADAMLAESRRRR